MMPIADLKVQHLILVLSLLGKQTPTAHVQQCYLTSWWFHVDNASQAVTDCQVWCNKFMWLSLHLTIS
jgi:hypothetical protein